MKTDFALAIERACRAAMIPAPIREYRFAAPRRWRFDIAWPEKKVAIEIEGGVFIGGAHVRGVHYESDCEKYNAAAVRGWTVLRYTTGMLRKRLYQIVTEEIKSCVFGNGKEAVK